MLKVSYSGIRGIVGDDLTPAVAYGFTLALGRFLAERRRSVSDRILVARDNRPSSPLLREAVLAALATLPVEVLDLGVCSTPTAQVACRALSADIALVITASHNPRIWNGFKYFVAPECIVMDGAQIKRLFAYYQEVSPGVPARWDPAPEPPDVAQQGLEAHRDGVLARVDIERIRARRFKVAVDFAGGAGAAVARAILERLGCEVVEVASDREPEPSVEALGPLCRAVVETGCQVGFAQDMDGDRLVLVNEKGQARGEDFTLALAVRHLLQGIPDPGSAVVVKNSSTTAMIDDLCSQFGARLVETPVGEVNLSRALLEAVAAGHPAFGGEGSGGVIYPPLLYGRDGATGVALTLDVLAANGATLSALENSLPDYHMAKTKMAQVDNLDDLFTAVRGLYPGARTGTPDGLKLLFPGHAWVQIRPSNTEPIMRVTAESREADWAEARVQEIVRLARR